jgi:hypothetical protein
VGGGDPSSSNFSQHSGIGAEFAEPGLTEFT